MIAPSLLPLLLSSTLFFAFLCPRVKHSVTSSISSILLTKERTLLVNYYQNRKLNIMQKTYCIGQQTALSYWICCLLSNYRWFNEPFIQSCAYNFWWFRFVCFIRKHWYIFSFKKCHIKRVFATRQKFLWNVLASK